MLRLRRLLKVGLLARGALRAMKMPVTAAIRRQAIDAVGCGTRLKSERSVNLLQARFFNSPDLRHLPSNYFFTVYGLVWSRNGLPWSFLEE